MVLVTKVAESPPHTEPRTGAWYATDAWWFARTFFRDEDPIIFAPARSAGASYSETGVSNDQVSIRSMSVRKKNEQNTEWYLRRPDTEFTTVIFSVDFQGAEEKCVCAVKE